MIENPQITMENSLGPGSVANEGEPGEGAERYIMGLRMDCPVAYRSFACHDFVKYYMTPKRRGSNKPPVAYLKTGWLTQKDIEKIMDQVNKTVVRKIGTSKVTHLDGSEEMIDKFGVYKVTPLFKRRAADVPFSEFLILKPVHSMAETELETMRAEMRELMKAVEEQKLRAEKAEQELAERDRPYTRPGTSKHDPDVVLGG